MIDNVMKMNIEEFRQQVKELSVEQHLLLSGWVYGFTDQAHKKIHDLLADEKPLPVDFKGEVILYTNPSPAQKGGIIGSVGPATASSVDFYLPELMNLGVIATIGKGERSREA